MEIGLGVAIAKIEEYFGKLYAKMLVFLATLALFALALSTTISLGVVPLYQLITAGKADPVFWHNLNSVYSPLWTVLSILVLVYFTIVDTIRARKNNAKLQEIERLLAARPEGHHPQ